MADSDRVWSLTWSSVDTSLLPRSYTFQASCAGSLHKLQLMSEEKRELQLQSLHVTSSVNRLAGSLISVIFQMELIIAF